MFPPLQTSTLAERALGALRLSRSFLLLEDDREVDWEVDQEGRAQASHPHRAALRRRSSRRRPGQPPCQPQVCLCPVGGEPLAHSGQGPEEVEAIIAGAVSWCERTRHSPERRRAARRRPVSI